MQNLPAIKKSIPIPPKKAVAQKGSLANGKGKKEAPKIPAIKGKENLKINHKRKKILDFVPLIVPKRAPIWNLKEISINEFLVILGVFAVIAALAVPLLQKYSANEKLMAAARAIESDLSDFKDRAIFENTGYAVEFDPEENKYTIQQNGTPVVVKTPKYFGPDIKIASAPFGEGAMVLFQPWGAANSGSINLVNRRGSTATISVNHAGRMYVQFNLL